MQTFTEHAGALGSEIFRQRRAKFPHNDSWVTRFFNVNLEHMLHCLITNAALQLPDGMPVLIRPSSYDVRPGSARKYLLLRLILLSRKCPHVSTCRFSCLTGLSPEPTAALRAGIDCARSELPERGSGGN